MTRDSMLEPILGFQNYQEFNRRSCLNGIPLGRLKSFYKTFQAGNLDSEQMVSSAEIAFRLYKGEIGGSVSEILSSRLERFNRDAKHPLTLAEYEARISPEGWNLTPGGLTREVLLKKTEELIGILEDSISKEKQKMNSK